MPRPKADTHAPSREESTFGKNSVTLSVSTHKPGTPFDAARAIRFRLGPTLENNRPTSFELALRGDTASPCLWKDGESCTDITRHYFSNSTEYKIIRGEGGVYALRNDGKFILLWEKTASVTLPDHHGKVKPSKFTKVIGSGVEAIVYQVSSSKAVKIYHNPLPDKDREETNKNLLDIAFILDERDLLSRFCVGLFSIKDPADPNAEKANPRFNMRWLESHDQMTYGSDEEFHRITKLLHTITELGYYYKDLYYVPAKSKKIICNSFNFILNPKRIVLVDTAGIRKRDPGSEPLALSTEELFFPKNDKLNGDYFVIWRDQWFLWANRMYRPEILSIYQKYRREITPTRTLNQLDNATEEERKIWKKEREFLIKIDNHSFYVDDKNTENINNGTSRSGENETPKIKMQFNIPQFIREIYGIPNRAPLIE
ncbi:MULTISPECIES: hypothetical protein [unclassified Caballeronia]|uniref:hypothetical protein n=1 Tax=unclassified Caballeronia TaxID=2646786 RepID=UPI0020288C61|nr:MULTISPECIES: hypothetical protein [unclassified Caballeronia]